MVTKTKKVMTECKECKGTGIYCGLSEPEGIGVPCTDCKGTGKNIIEYTPFTRKIKRDDIKFVRNGLDRSNTVTYEQFLDGTMPD